MTLAPLLSSPIAIQLHAFAAMAAFVLGLVQFAAPKGTLPHRTLGWIWVALMLIVGVSAFFIHTLRVWGPWSPFHLLAVYTVIMLPAGIWQARKHSVKTHRKIMISIFVSGLVIAGACTKWLPESDEEDVMR
jgi:uncharacterized membrane protein